MTQGQFYRVCASFSFPSQGRLLDSWALSRTTPVATAKPRSTIADLPSFYGTRDCKNSNSGTVCYVVENSLFRIGAKNTAECQVLSPSGHKKTNKTPDLTRDYNSNDIAHGSII